MGSDGGDEDSVGREGCAAQDGEGEGVQGGAGFEEEVEGCGQG